jgi:hypothetical protein
VTFFLRTSLSGEIEWHPVFHFFLVRFLFYFLPAANRCCLWRRGASESQQDPGGYHCPAALRHTSLHPGGIQVHFFLSMCTVSLVPDLFVWNLYGKPDQLARRHKMIWDQARTWNDTVYGLYGHWSAIVELGHSPSIWICMRACCLRCFRVVFLNHKTSIIPSGQISGLDQGGAAGNRLTRHTMLLMTVLCAFMRS